MENSATLMVQVARKTKEAEGIFSFELRAVSAVEKGLPAFSAGAHIDVHVPGGPVRQYSLCNDPQETDRYCIAVLRDPQSRGGSRALHDQVEAGDLLTISRPKNHFPLNADAPHSLLLAGGIGVTPLLAMAEALTADGRSFDFHYAVRSLDKAAFLPHMAASGFAQQVHIHADDGAAEQKLALASVLAGAAATTHLYVCGPQGFMDAVLGKARETGWAESRLHFEFFSAQVITSASDAPFEVEIASTGQRIAVPKDVPVTHALAQAGIEIMTACEQGVCGTCLTRVLAGTPDHRDSYLSPEERAANDQFMPCCSRAKTATLRLDL